MFLLLRYYMTADKIARELWWTNKEFSPVDIIPQWLCILMYLLGVYSGPLVAAVQRHEQVCNCEISGSHGGEYEVQSLLGCTAV
jgi:hypothetical protein